MTCRSSLLSGRRPDCGESYSHQGWAEDKTASPGRTAESVEGQAGCREPRQAGAGYGQHLSSFHKGTHARAWVWVGRLSSGNVLPFTGQRLSHTGHILKQEAGLRSLLSLRKDICGEQEETC